jgi:ribonuclease III
MSKSPTSKEYSDEEIATSSTDSEGDLPVVEFGSSPTKPMAELEAAIGYTFTDQKLLKNSLVHKSYLHDVPDFYLSSNERLEFLGDAVLSLIVSSELFLAHPERTEGELTALRGAQVRKNTLAELGAPLELAEYMYMSKGEEAAGGRTRDSNLARVVEAILGAVYLDGGLKAAVNVWHTMLGSQSDNRLNEVLSQDYKSQLQRFTQALFRITPVYRLTGTSGPEHAKQFHVEAMLGDRVLASGAGRNKQIAEQAAAQEALQKLSEEPQ